MPTNKSPNSTNRGRRERRARIRPDRRAQPDLTKIAFTIQALALAQAEKEAQAHADQAQANRKKGTRP